MNAISIVVAAARYQPKPTTGTSKFCNNNRHSKMHIWRMIKIHVCLFGCFNERAKPTTIV